MAKYFLILLMCVANLAVACRAVGHPHIKRWAFEGAIYLTSDPDQPDPLFDDIRLGDPVRGTIAYDTSVSKSCCLFIQYEFALTFDLASIVIENPRTGEDTNLLPDLSVFVTILDDYPSGDETYDMIYIAQYVTPPPLDSSLNQIELVLRDGDAISDSVLPSTLDLDDWSTATVRLWGFLTDNEIWAEIHSLTPIDAPYMPGDFNGDGVIDGRDLGVWQFAFASVNTNLAADGNADLRVDGADFLAWQQQLGSSDPAVSANALVPEPATLMLVIVAAAGSRRISGRMRQELVGA